MNLFKLFSLSYLFQLQPGSEFKFMVPLIAFFLILALGSFYLEKWINRQPHRKAIKELLPNAASHLRTFGIIGFLLLFFLYENIPYFAMRIVLILFLIGILVYVGRNLYKFKKHLPELLDKKDKKTTHHKYLPKSKKKKNKKKRR
jgi:amino acid transporter